MFDVRVSPTKVVQRSGLQSIYEIEAPKPHKAQVQVPPDSIDFTFNRSPPTYQTLMAKYDIEPRRMLGMNHGLLETDPNWPSMKPHGVVFLKHGAYKRHLEDMKVSSLFLSFVGCLRTMMVVRTIGKSSSISATESSISETCPSATDQIAGL